MKLMVLDKNKNENNSKSSLRHTFKRLNKEVDELAQAVADGDNNHIAEEVLDVIQMCIAMLFKLFISGLDIENAIHKHNRKLMRRGWKPSAIIKVQVNRICGVKKVV